MLKPKAINVTPLEDFRLFVEWETGEKRVFDVKPYMVGDWFGQLRNPDTFRSIRPRGSTVEWADGQDIAPHELYELSTEAPAGCVI